MENDKSYLSMESDVKIHMNNISPNDLTLGKIIPTMRSSYIEGANKMDSKWRKAIITYAERHNIPTSNLIQELINILNHQ